MSTDCPPVVDSWVLDSSLFIHFCIARRTKLLYRVRSPITIPDYVYRTELVGPSTYEETRRLALEAVTTSAVKVERLTLEDVARMATLGPRRSAAIGELACAILAERKGWGVLIDDRRAVRWLKSRVRVDRWHDTETVLIDAAHRYELTEYDLDEIEAVLRENRYTCRLSLRTEFLMQRLARHSHDRHVQAENVREGLSNSDG